MGKTQTPAYVVRSLIQYKIQRKIEYVLVWWKGYRKDEATWEPIRNVLTIQLFQKQLKEIKQKWRNQQEDKKDGNRKRDNSKLSQPDRRANIEKKEYQSQEAIAEYDEEDQEQSLSNKVFEEIVKLPPKSKKIFKSYQKQLDSLKNWLKAKEPLLATPQKDLIGCKEEYMSESKNRKCQFQLNNLLDKHAHTQKQQASEIAQQQNFADKKEFIPLKQEQMKISTPIHQDNNNRNQKEQNKISEKPMKISYPIGQFTENGRQRMNLIPMRFEIRIKEFKDIPFLDQQLKEIKKAFYKDGELLYEIIFESNKQPIVIHQRYMNLMWPRRYAEYLITKIDKSNYC